MKFLMITHRPVNHPIVTVFARELDGMLFGQVMGSNVHYGSDPKTANVRSFIDREHAIEFMKNWLGSEGFAPTFEEKEGDPMVASVSNMPSGMRM